MSLKPPAFDTLWANYPVGSSPDVRREIGGQVDNDDYANTCAIRLSRTLNLSGQPIKPAQGLLTVRGGDGKRYALRMRELTTYLQNRWGRPQVRVRRPDGDTSQFDGKKGVISFLGIPGYTGGGHIDLWDGSRTQQGAYFDSNEVLLWEAPLVAAAAPDEAPEEVEPDLVDDGQPSWELEPSDDQAEQEPAPAVHPARGTEADPTLPPEEDEAQGGGGGGAPADVDDDDPPRQQRSSSSDAAAAGGAAPQGDDDPPFWVPPGESIEVPYEVLCQPPPATRAVAEVYRHAASGDPIATHTLVDQGGSTLALSLSGRTVEDSPLVVRFTFEKEGARQPLTTVDRIFSLGEPEVREITAPADARPGDSIHLAVTEWAGFAYDEPGRPTFFSEPLDDGRVPDAAKQDVQWRADGKALDVTGHEVDWTIPEDRATGGDVLLEAFRRSSVPGTAYAQRRVKLGKASIHGAGAGAARPAPMAVVPKDGSVRFKAHVDPAIEGTWSWSCESDKVQLTPSSTGRVCTVKGLTESDEDGDVTLEATLTSEETGIAYVAEHVVSVRPGLAIRAHDGGEPSRFVPLWHAQRFRACVPEGWRGAFQWRTSSERLRLRGATTPVVSVIGRTTHSDGLDAETLEVTFTPADGGEPLTVTHTVAVIRVIFSAASNQKYGFDNMDFQAAPHVSVRKCDSTTVRVRLQGGATSDDVHFTADDDTTADASPPPGGQTEFDLTVNGKAKNKAEAALRARLDGPQGPTCSWPLMVNVYKLKDMSLTFYHVSDSTSDGTALSRRLDVAELERLLNAWYRPAVARIRIDGGGDIDAPFDKNDNGKLDLQPGGTSEEAQEVRRALTGPGKKAVLVKDLTWLYMLREDAAAGATVIKLRTSYSRNMKFIKEGNSYTVGAGASAERVRVQSKSGTDVTLAAPLRTAKTTDDGLVWPLNGLSGDPFYIKEAGNTVLKNQRTFGHENGHEQLKLKDVVNRKLLMHYTSSDREDTRIRFRPQVMRYEEGEENQWEKVPRD
ncbi:MAG: type VI secretion system amidase effector protein Tae4 [Planctomycetes bacterium]|nr:type VI secretion system amidase effector protein Tae4 [Planctomycetota bacterium]